MNYYFLRYVRWDAGDSKEHVLEFLAPASTADDAKTFCDVATTHEGRRSIPMREWRHERMEAATEDAYEAADHREGWGPMGDGRVKRRWKGLEG